MNLLVICLIYNKQINRNQLMQTIDVDEAEGNLVLSNGKILTTY